MTDCLQSFLFWNWNNLLFNNVSEIFSRVFILKFDWCNILPGLIVFRKINQISLQNVLELKSVNLLLTNVTYLLQDVRLFWNRCERLLNYFCCGTDRIDCFDNVINGPGKEERWINMNDDQLYNFLNNNFFIAETGLLKTTNLINGVNRKKDFFILSGYGNITIFFQPKQLTFYSIDADEHQSTDVTDRLTDLKWRMFPLVRAGAVQLLELG